ncbi:MAG: 1-deoxy-D-xylulose-5-phosphate reductoisomerase, partial [Clostridia bacterium]|nr:1-deoxy-D-xylulose-5-phosphate reductoisomerase [Clostridia bacterium]
GIIYMNKVALIGSTGSIGKQVINVVRRHPSRFKLVALIANGSKDELLRQAAELKPQYAALTDNKIAKSVKEVPDGVTFLQGDDGALAALENCGADVVVVACGGFAGLKYSLKTAELGLALALANKETLVCGGDLVMPRIKEIMPVDSEHSAIWQCLNFNRNAPFDSLVITASGGAFRGRKWETLANVSPSEALAHPTWKMGAKITVDCATLLNKGYEIIEAHHLYNAPYSKISAVIHPQSIVHSMVRFKDGATLAQLSYPTMELPIQLALTYPERLDCGLEQLDFSKALSLEFLPLERKDYPLYSLALDCGVAGGILPTSLNAASEVAVNAFLKGALSFTDIYTVADKVVSKTANGKVQSYEQLALADEQARRLAEKIIKEA